MPQHRLAFFFVDEAPGDMAIWKEWLAAAPPPIQAATVLGERRPLLTLSAPFSAQGVVESAVLAEDTEGLELLSELAELLLVTAASSKRSIRLLLSGRPFGTLDPQGRDAAFTAKTEEWTQLVATAPAAEQPWERKGWVSMWGGTLPRAELDMLLKEHYGSDGPISGLARGLRINYYEHETVESIHTANPVAARASLAKLSSAESFLEKIPAEFLDMPITTLIAVYDSDFTKRPRDISRRRLRYFGSYPYKG